MRGRKQEPTVDIRVRRALFVAPERWASVAGQWSKPFKRRLYDYHGLGHGVNLWAIRLGCLIYFSNIPVHEPLPFGRIEDAYFVKAIGVEDDRLVVYVA